MPRFLNLLVKGFEERGHEVSVWQPKARFVLLPVPGSLKKWLGYLDQYVLFPLEVRIRLRKCSLNTLFVFTDQALGPWVPLVKNKPHVVHCHDFLAQRSALNEIAEFKTSWTGKQYQAFIRQGYTKGKNFISVSEKTREDLHHFLKTKPILSEVVYNGLNNNFNRLDADKARNELSGKTRIDLSNGYLLHVGGNQWYKNRKGVIEIYNAFRLLKKYSLPLLMIGEAPDQELLALRNHSPYKQDMYFLTGIENEDVRLGYSGASLFLFPSLAEGFGWPIAEAMAAGCPVITTSEAPMTEVAGKAGFFIKKRPLTTLKAGKWAHEAALVIEKVVSFSNEQRAEAIGAGLINAKRFDPEVALNIIEELYLKILQEFI